MTAIRHFHRVALIPAFVLAACLAMPAVAQDKKAAPDKKPAPAAEKDKAAKPDAGRERKVILENDKVVVTEIRYKPGAGSDMIERGPRVTRALTDGTLERTYPDGKKQLNHWKAGEVKYFPKEKFANKNVGKTEVVLYSVALK